MPDDFETFARKQADRIYEWVDGHNQPRTEGSCVIMNREWFIEVLKLAWNARGQVDMDAVGLSLDQFDA